MSATVSVTRLLTAGCRRAAQSHAGTTCRHMSVWATAPVWSSGGKIDNMPIKSKHMQKRAARRAAEEAAERGEVAHYEAAPPGMIHTLLYTISL